jgi:hypothetical protein
MRARRDDVCALRAETRSNFRVPFDRDVFLFVTLDKEGHPEQHRYGDRFLSATESEWQSGTGWALPYLEPELETSGSLDRPRPRAASALPHRAVGGPLRMHPRLGLHAPRYRPDRSS